MRINQDTYRRAKVFSIFGLIFQTVVTGVVFILAYGFQDDVTKTAAQTMAFGLPVWLALLLIFHQHRRERIEAVEFDELRTRATLTGSIFEFHDVESLTQAARLRWMYKYLLPAASLLVGGLLIIFGWIDSSNMAGKLGAQFGSSSNGLLTAGQTVAGYGAGICAFFAVTSFIVSWYLGGLSRQPAWVLLRSGATVAISNAILNACLAVGFGFLVGGNPVVMRVLARAVPIYMIVLGAETVISFVLNLYTPRQAGQYPRAAFDSRILGLFAAPESVIKSINDAVNYQFGFEVTRSWFYQLLSRQILPLVGVVVGLIILLQCVAVIAPNEQGIVTSFGRLIGGDQAYQPGLIFKWPWEVVTHYDVARVNEITVGTKTNNDVKAILWDNEHAVGEEPLLIVAPSRVARVENLQNSSSYDFEVLNTEVSVQYRIKQGLDPTTGRAELLNYIMAVGGDPAAHTTLVTQVATRAVQHYLETLSIDDILGARRSDLSSQLQRLIQKDLDDRQTGVEVVFVGVAGIHPPKDVVPSFEQVLQAREEKEATIEQAMATAIKTLATEAGSQAKADALVANINMFQSMNDGDPAKIAQGQKVEQAVLSAGGAAAKTLFDARSQRWARAMTALVTTISQNGKLAPYLAAPRLYQWREYLSTLAEGLKTNGGHRLIITPRGVQVRATVNLEQDPNMLDIGGAISGNEASMNEGIKSGSSGGGP